MSVAVVARSGNKKLGPMAATYAPMTTCPGSCPIKDSCYGKWDQVAMREHRLRYESMGMGPYELAKEEADKIDNLTCKVPLRIHVVGDCADSDSAWTVGTAMERYEERNGQPAWAYTHAWRDYNYDQWATAMVRASCESVGDIVHATQAGYCHYVLVVSKFMSHKAYNLHGIKVVPCPNQTRGVQCIKCKLCARRDVEVIAFEAHGRGRKKLLEVVE